MIISLIVIYRLFTYKLIGENLGVRLGKPGTHGREKEFGTEFYITLSIYLFRSPRDGSASSVPVGGTKRYRSDRCREANAAGKQTLPHPWWPLYRPRSR